MQPRPARHPFSFSIALSTVVALFAATPISAQDAAATRAEALKRQREEKAQTVTPPSKPSIFTRVWDFAESTYGPQASQYNGFTPRVGSVISGGGFAVGGRYRNTLLFDRRAGIELGAMASVKRYYRVNARFNAPRIAGGPFFVSADVQQLEYPQEDFFGPGPDSVRDDRTNFLYKEFRTGARAGVELTERLDVGAGLAYVSPGIGRGRDSLYPSTDTEFTEQEAPGLTSQPTFLMSSAFLDWNRVGDPEHPRTGQRVQVTFTNASDRESGHYSYRQLDVDGRQFVPFFQGKRVIVFRGWYSTSFTDGGDEMPFYLQPFLGGRRTLRGYDDARFRGPHALLMQAEYRFEVWPALDMAVFVDAGKVAQTRADLDLSDLKKDYGVSFRFGGESALFRIDLAFGGETRLISFAFGDVF